MPLKPVASLAEPTSLPKARGSVICALSAPDLAARVVTFVVLGHLMTMTAVGRIFDHLSLAFATPTSPSGFTAPATSARRALPLATVLRKNFSAVIATGFSVVDATPRVGTHGVFPMSDQLDVFNFDAAPVRAAVACCAAGIRVGVTAMVRLQVRRDWAMGTNVCCAVRSALARLWIAARPITSVGDGAVPQQASISGAGGFSRVMLVGFPDAWWHLLVGYVHLLVAAPAELLGAVFPHLLASRADEDPVSFPHAQVYQNDDATRCPL